MMKYYLGDRFLFVDMHQKYTHCVVEGDRVLCCQKSQAEADNVCRNIVSERRVRLNVMKELLQKGHAYTTPKQTAYGIDLRDLYPTAGLLNAGIRRVEKTIRSIQVMPLTVKL
jgi:hypothetical protein